MYSLAMLAAQHSEQHAMVPSIAERARAGGVRLNEGSYTVLIKARDDCRFYR